MFRLFRNYNKYDYIIVLLIASLTFGGYGGALQVSRILAFILFPLLFSNFRKCKDYATGVLAFCICIFLYALFSLTWTLDMETGVKELLYLLIHSILFLELIVFARYAHKPLESLSMGWVVFLILCLSVSTWEIVTNNHLPMARDADATTRIDGSVYYRRYASHTYGDINAYSTMLCFAVPWVYYHLMAISKTLMERIVDIILISFSFIICIYNGTRGGSIAMSIMLIVYILKSMNSIKSIILILCVFIAVGLFISYYAPDLFIVLKARDVQDTRSAVWLVAWKVIVNDGFMGTGIGGDMASMGKFGYITVPHNAVIELCLIYGIIFTIVFLLYQYRLLRNTIRIKSKYKKCVLLILFASMPLSLLIHSHYLNLPGLYVLLATQFVFTKYPNIHWWIRDEKNETYIYHHSKQ